MLILIGAFLLTFFIPEIPLRRRSPGGAPLAH